MGELREMAERILTGEDIIPKTKILETICNELVELADHQKDYDRLLVYSLLLPRPFTILLGGKLYRKNRRLVKDSSKWFAFSRQLIVVEKISPWQISQWSRGHLGYKEAK